MSGTFENIDVPPTLVSFAVTTGTTEDVITNHFKKNGHKVPDDIKPGQSLRSISFTGTEKMLFYYSDGSADVSAYRFNGKSFTYRWDNDKMGFTFLTDQATVEYLDGKCILTIRASIQDSTTSGSVTFVLSPMD